MSLSAAIAGESVDAVEESSVMDERLRFVARVLEGEPMTDLCREFGISRKTGLEQKTLQTLDNPFGTRLLPMS